MCALSDDRSSVVVDREPEQDKSFDPSGPRIRCPLCGWSPRKDDVWSCTCGHEWNTFETGGVCPACLHLDCNTMPSLPPLVAPFGLVCGVTEDASEPDVSYYSGTEPVKPCYFPRLQG